MSPADLRAVIVTYGIGGEHVPLLGFLLEEEGLEAGQVTLVHNPAGESDEEPASVPGVAVMPMEENLGYAHAMNAGLRAQLEAGAPAVLLLTHDARLRPGAVARLVAAADENPSFGILGPVIWSRHDGAAWSYGGVRLPNGRVEHRRVPPNAADITGGVARCEWVDGATMLVRSEALRAAGLFDERFFMYYDEADLCLRAARAGWQVGVVLDAVAEQSPGELKRPGAYAYLSSRNGLEYARRADGARGVLRLTGAKVAESWGHAKWVIKERSDPEVRARVRTELAATWLGVADFARRRWGPPPPSLRGLGDVEVRHSGSAGAS